jgi:pimeloyl-ACP methyl ester carboxylesterase
MSDARAFAVVLAHGLEGHPEGTKAQTLMAAGFHVVAPDGRGLPLAQRIEGVEEALAANPGAVLVGSSYGGLAAVVVASRMPDRLWALVLCAPALGRREPPVDDPSALRVPPSVPCTVLHGVRDEVVPIALSRALVQRCPHVVLREVEDGHRLADSLDVLVEMVREALALPR